ncbi:MAG: 3-hydroxyacyl-CoA dehydrogenase [Actinobacteria bacterium]|nr:3-hydroxyacyl-CoA dehydrogenase [Actinomycetota bacterium]MBU1944275.1 3-hydroxyacyl-CoA dehydrogenase [Actinomycetota bacterium]MBU2688828.1 3-hydroxyacyl-CoA dehydrogenase [Actinomycetota bacterium]
MGIDRVFVVGAGFMGAGIAQVAATAGYDVTICDVDRSSVDAGMGAIKTSLDELVSSGNTTRELAGETLGRLETTTDMDGARVAGIVVEAVPEKLQLKREVFNRLDETCRPDAILATNTSAIPITSIAAATGRPERVVGTHFFGPVPVMKLCEIVSGLLTSAETSRAADAWATGLGKDTILVCRDIAGFVANRTSILGSLEAVRFVDEGLATPEQVDAAAPFGAELGAGPLNIMDGVGLDVMFSTAIAIYQDTGEARFFPPPILRRLVTAGLLGRKTGRGFYDYTAGERRSYPLFGMETSAPVSPERSGLMFKRIIIPSLLEGIRVLEAGVASREDIDKATRLAFHFALGPLEAADGMGLDELLESASVFYEETGNETYLPPPLLREMVSAGSLGRKSGRGFYDYGEYRSGGIPVDPRR